MTPKVNGIHEVAVVVTDLERSEKFYTEVLGMGVLFRIPNVCVTVKMGDSPHHFIGLWLPNTHGAYQNNVHGKMHFTMKINMEDADAWEEQFKKHGLNIPRRVKENGDIHFDFDDPDGHPVEFWARTGTSLSTMPGIEVPEESRHMFYNLDDTTP